MAVTKAAPEAPVEAAAPDHASAAPAAPLPPLETMVGRIPPGVREALDDLFRVKFVSVQRIPASVLKTPGAS